MILDSTALLMANPVHEGSFPIWTVVMMPRIITLKLAAMTRVVSLINSALLREGLFDNHQQRDSLRQIYPLASRLITLSRRPRCPP